MNIFRARLAIVSAVVFAVVLVTVEFPFSEIVHQRAALGAASTQLSSVQSIDNRLRAEIKSLHRPTTIAAIAHEEYGLVQAGQRSYVILPGPNSGATSGIAPASVPVADLVAVPDNSLTPDKVGAAGHSNGLFERFLARLEFWK